jgi:hypothetical protein
MWLKRTLNKHNCQLLRTRVFLIVWRYLILKNISKTVPSGRSGLQRSFKYEWTAASLQNHPVLMLTLTYELRQGAPLGFLITIMEITGDVKGGNTPGQQDVVTPSPRLCLCGYPKDLVSSWRNNNRSSVLQRILVAADGMLSSPNFREDITTSTTGRPDQVAGWKFKVSVKFAVPKCAHFHRWTFWTFIQPILLK